MNLNPTCYGSEITDSYGVITPSTPHLQPSPPPQSQPLPFPPPESRSGTENCTYTVPQGHSPGSLATTDPDYLPLWPNGLTQWWLQSPKSPSRPFIFTLHIQSSANPVDVMFETLPHTFSTATTDFHSTITMPCFPVSSVVPQLDNMLPPLPSGSLCSIQQWDKSFKTQVRSYSISVQHLLGLLISE
jgi:hypothetical protein